MDSIDPWQEFKAMTPDEANDALAYVAGADPDLFARVMERTRPHRERGRLRAQVSAACRRLRDAEVTE